jgi:cytochrome c-type biogenesis protein CcmE
MDQGVFRAEEVLAKHDEAYMPPEVAEKIQEAHAKAAAAKAAQAQSNADPAQPSPAEGGGP